MKSYALGTSVEKSREENVHLAFTMVREQDRRTEQQKYQWWASQSTHSLVRVSEFFPYFPTNVFVEKITQLFIFFAMSKIIEPPSLALGPFKSYFFSELKTNCQTSEYDWVPLYPLPAKTTMKNCNSSIVFYFAWMIGIFLELTCQNCPNYRNCRNKRPGCLIFEAIKQFHNPSVLYTPPFEKWLFLVGAYFRWALISASTV